MKHRVLTITLPIDLAFKVKTVVPLYKLSESIDIPSIYIDNILRSKIVSRNRKTNKMHSRHHLGNTLWDRLRRYGSDEFYRVEVKFKTQERTETVLILYLAYIGNCYQGQKYYEQYCALSSLLYHGKSWEEIEALLPKIKKGIQMKQTLLKGEI